MAFEVTTDYDKEMKNNFSMWGDEIQCVLCFRFKWRDVFHISGP